MAGLALSAALLLASPASGATLTGDYQMQGSTASSGPGPVLTGIGPSSAFQSDNVMGVSRQVLAFPKGAGLQMAPSGAGAGQYSVVMTFRFDEVDVYRRIVDPFNATSDYGLYAHDSHLSIFRPGANDESPTALFSPNTYATVAMVRIGFPEGVKAYFNGGLVAQFAAGDFSTTADTLRFFKDDGSTGEESAGAVSCIRVYSGALTDPEVAAIGANPRCGAPAPSPAATPSPAAKKKKCKKKKKHRAAEAKKKKCKKKKKKQ